MAVELDEDFVEARCNLGCLLAEEGERELAVAALEGALAHHPGYADAHYHLARPPTSEQVTKGVTGLRLIVVGRDAACPQA
jgi:Tfp pilus assembly protein PilF